MFTLRSYIMRLCSLTTVLCSSMSDIEITVTNVYAPSDHRDSQDFLDSLLEIKPRWMGRG